MKQSHYFSRLSLAIVALTALVACQSAPTVTPGVGFNIAQADSVGVQGVYQEADKTFLLFAHFVPEATVIYGPNGKRLPMARSGRLVGIAGQHKRLGVRLGGAMAVAQRVKVSGDESTIPSQVWPNRLAIIQQLKQLGNENNVDDRLKSTSDRSVGALGPSAASAEPSSKTSQQVIRFVGKSMNLKSKPAIRETVRRANSATGLVVIRGVVPPSATSKQVEMAKKRARVVQSMIVSGGVNEKRTVVASVRERWDRAGDSSNDARVSVSFTPRRQ